MEAPSTPNSMGKKSDSQNTCQAEMGRVLAHADDHARLSAESVENRKEDDILFSDRPTLKQLQPFAAMLDSDDDTDQGEVKVGKSRRSKGKKRDARQYAPYKKRGKDRKHASAKVASTTFLLEHWSVSET